MTQKKIQVWRIHLHPKGGEEEVDSCSFCLKKKILGIGWGVDYKGKKLDYETYYKLGKEKYVGKKKYRKSEGWKKEGWAKASKAIGETMQIDDLCWTRDSDGVYYVGRVRGEWEYKQGKEYDEADIVNVRDCDWQKVGTVDKVPGEVVKSLFRGGTLRRIKGVSPISVLNFSKFLYNTLSKKNFYKFDLDKKLDLFSLIFAEDFEDVVGLYLQKEKGYFIIPGTCKSDTPGYEFVLIHKTSSKRAVVQVKSGEDNLRIEDYIKYVKQGHNVFLFTSRGKYIYNREKVHYPKRIWNPIKGVYCIGVEVIKKFIDDNFDIMPGRVQTWIKFVKKSATKRIKH